MACKRGAVKLEGCFINNLLLYRRGRGQNRILLWWSSSSRNLSSSFEFSNPLPNPSTTTTTTINHPPLFSNNNDNSNNSLSSPQQQPSSSSSSSDGIRPNKYILNVDSAALVERLESKGWPRNQAESLTSLMSEVVNNTLDNFSYSLVFKPDLHKSLSTQESDLSKYKIALKSTQDHHISVLQHVTEKLKSDIDKMRSDLRYESDKVTAGQRLDLNLERGRIKDELNKQNQETTKLTSKLDREINEIRAQLDTSKSDVIRYCVAILASVSAVGLAAIRILT